MKLIQMTCPCCSAKLTVPEDAKQVTCSYCGTVSAVAPPKNQIEVEDAEALGYQFEKGRQKMHQEMGIIQGDTKFCPYCGAKIAKAAVICVHCGCQVAEFSGANPQPNPSYSDESPAPQPYSYSAPAAQPVSASRMRNKWVAFLLCMLLGGVGAHKFYEGKFGMGILYLLTFGLFGIGWFVDLIVLLCKPTEYPV